MCPHCGARHGPLGGVDLGWLQRPEVLGRIRRWWKSRTRGERFGTVAGVVLVGSFVLAVAGELGVLPSDNPLELSPIEVVVDCERAVESQLLAPSTAEFIDSDTDGVRKTGAVRYMYVGVVEAQNAFGVPLRSPFVCELEFEDGRWRTSATVESPL